MNLKRLFDIRRWLPSRRRTRDEIDEEFHFHLQQRALDSEAEGMDPAEARRDAEQRFGDIRHYREQGEKVLHGHARRQARASFADGLMQDFRLAFRLALRTPTVTGLAILALALGIGANTAVFSVMEAVLLPSFDHPDADRMVQLNTTGLQEAWAQGRAVPLSADRYFEYRDQTDAFEQLVAVSFGNLLLEGQLRTTLSLTASDGFLDLLGVQPLLGRGLSRDVDVRRGPASTFSPGTSNLEMLLTYDFWQEKFGGDSTVVGRTVNFGATREGDPIPRRIVGVLPPGFQFPPMRVGRSLRTVGFAAVLPLSEGFWVRDVRNYNPFFVLGKLREDSSLEQARTQLEAVAARIGAQYPDEATIVPLLTPIRELPRVFYGRSLLLLWAIVVSVLLIACLNVASLVLARTAARDGELAVRYSLGGARRRIVRQLVTESVLLAAVGGALGVALAWAGTRAAVALFPGSMRGLADATINGSVLGITVLLSLTTVLLFGWAPAVLASRVNLAERLKGISRGFTLSSGRIFQWLVATEVALALVLFLGAGLLLNSFIRLTSVELGFDRDHVLAVTVDLPRAQISKYGTGEGQIPVGDVHDRLIAAVEAIPGVTGSSILVGSRRAGLPLVGRGGTDITVEDRHRPGVEQGLSGFFWTNVSPGYFELMGIPLLAGRTFGPQDMSGTEDVAVISESAALKFWPGADPLGKRLTWGQQDLENEIYDRRYYNHRLFTVVGVVGDVASADLTEDAARTVYSPTARGYGTEYARGGVVLVRTSGDPSALAGAVREAVIGVDEAEIEVTEIVTMRSLFSDVVAQPRFYVFILGLLAVVALVLVLSGVYGVLTYMVNRRRPELGLRMALGAHPEAVRTMMLRQGLTPVALGAVGGLALTFYLGRFLTSYLFDVRPSDPLTVGVALTLVFGMAALACYLPARHASAIDPVDALRME